MPEPELTAQEIVERQTRVAGQMRRHIKRDKHWKDEMHQLPADPEGLPRDMLFSAIAKEHTVSLSTWPSRRWTRIDGRSTTWPRISRLATLLIYLNLIKNHILVGFGPVSEPRRGRWTRTCLVQYLRLMWSWPRCRSRRGR